MALGKRFLLHCTTSSYALFTLSQKSLPDRSPHTKFGGCIGTDSPVLPWSDPSELISPSPACETEDSGSWFSLPNRLSVGGVGGVLGLAGARSPSLGFAADLGVACLFLQFPNLPGKQFPHLLPDWAHLHPEHDPLRLHLQQGMSHKEQLKLIQSPLPTD